MASRGGKFFDIPTFVAPGVYTRSSIGIGSCRHYAPPLPHSYSPIHNQRLEIGRVGLMDGTVRNLLRGKSKGPGGTL